MRAPTMARAGEPLYHLADLELPNYRLEISIFTAKVKTVRSKKVHTLFLFDTSKTANFAVGRGEVLPDWNK